MTNLILQILAGGGLLLIMIANRLVLLVLYPLCVGLILGTFAERVLYLMLAGKAYKSALSASESDKPK